MTNREVCSKLLEQYNDYRAEQQKASQIHPHGHSGDRVKMMRVEYYRGLADATLAAVHLLRKERYEQ